MVSEKTKKIMSQKKMGKNNPMFGIPRSDETKQKISRTKKENYVKENHPMYNKHHTDKSKRKNSDSHKGIAVGKNNPMYGRSVYSVWLEKYGKEEADKREKERNNKHSMSISGENNVSKRLKVRKKLRVSAIKRIENRYGQCIPNYNPDACKLIDEYGRKNGYNFQHAENGGEVCIDGYYPDGLDESRKTIIEIDEKHHFNIDGTLKKKDVSRQNYLENLGYDVIRIKFGDR